MIQFPEDLRRIVVPLTCAFYVKPPSMLCSFHFGVIFKIIDTRAKVITLYDMLTQLTMQQRYPCQCHIFGGFNNNIATLFSPNTVSSTIVSVV